MYTVVESSIFEAEKVRYWSDDECLEFVSWIACNAKAGEVVPGSGGVRKIRWQAKGAGKRAGVRVIYFAGIENYVHLMTIYGKKRQREYNGKRLEESKRGTSPMSKNNRIEDADRDLAAELLAAAKEIKSGNGKVVPTSEIVAARVNLNMSQAQFSALLGVSVRTLQKWEQNERQPSAAAQKLITIALKRPEVLIELFAA